MARDIKFHADEHIPLVVVEGLRLRGVNITTVMDAETRTQSDEVQLDYAHEHGRVMLTQDDDYLRLHAAGRPHCGIAYVHQGVPVGFLVRSALQLFESRSADDVTGRIVYL